MLGNADRLSTWPSLLRRHFIPTRDYRSQQRFCIIKLRYRWRQVDKNMPWLHRRKRSYPHYGNTKVCTDTTSKKTTTWFIHHHAHSTPWGEKFRICRSRFDLSENPIAIDTFQNFTIKARWNLENVCIRGNSQWCARLFYFAFFNRLKNHKICGYST